MPKIKINGREIEAEAGQTILQVALANGIYIPHFCYHPHLPISGNCRMCLVNVKPGPPKPSIACATVVADGMEIDTESESVAAARRAVMEFILKNHPLDCPICDQAGECALHEYYMKYDLQPSRLLSPEEKVKKKKRLRMGPTLVLDSERCILCTRCIRFMREIGGDDCLTIARRSDKSEITTFPGRVIEHPYSLCLTDVCPVGAWTSADFRFKQRVWFLTSSPSVCPFCARGCNIWIDHRRGEVYRFRPRVNEAINKSWMCDQGRLKYHAINDNRLRAPRIKNREASWEEALGRAADLLRARGSNLAVVVSASLSLEEGKKALNLFKEKLSAKVYLHVGPAGEEDNLLRRADQNANTRGLRELGISDQLESGLPAETAVVLLETVCPHPLPQGIPAAQVVISPTCSPAVASAEVALPSASFAESSGTVVNFEGVAQKYEPAFPPPAQALTMIEVLDRLALALGFKGI